MNILWRISVWKQMDYARLVGYLGCFVQILTENEKVMPGTKRRPSKIYGEAEPPLLCLT